MITRKPIITVVGHVDHGKTSLLDTIRQSTVVDREAGAITQAIGASIVPTDTIRRLCGHLLQKLNIDLKIPGFLFIDTPGHAAFTNLRKRGGNLADIAILIVDINEGFKPQTFEAIEILRQYKTPFIVAANKIDLISGWIKNKGSLIETINAQPQNTQYLFEEKLYKLVGTFNEAGFEADRFDRVSDVTKQISIVPICAKSGDGIPELLMMLMGLASRFLQKQLEIDQNTSAKGTILEIKEEQGLGMTMDVILYDGKMSVGDTLVIGGVDAPVVTKVKILVEPKPLAEMRDKKTKFSSTKEVIAATGVKIVAVDVDKVIAGMPIRVAKKDELERIKEEIQGEVEEVMIETDEEGLIIKADTLGSLEAMITLLREKNIQIRKALIGNVSKKDVLSCQSAANELNRVILGFNVEMTPDAHSALKDSGVSILTNKIIYRLVEDFEKWVELAKKKIEERELDNLVRPCKILLMPNYVFRQNNPAIMGADILSGKVKVGTQLMNKDGHVITSVKGLEHQKESLTFADAGKQVALSMDNVTVGRQIFEGDILYSEIPEAHFRKMKEFKHLLSPKEIDILKEIAEIKRKDRPVWGI